MVHLLILIIILVAFGRNSVNGLSGLLIFPSSQLFLIAIKCYSQRWIDVKLLDGMDPFQKKDIEGFIQKDGTWKESSALEETHCSNKKTVCMIFKCVNDTCQYLLFEFL